ncbi:hypothetical protein [Pleurocapsa sp. PCC 7319]|uniref:hypothetical protein n=1 Tax=Pleurocapsa sp. PCC 7319 TaxID=118161 RepID=UPI00034A28F9|nr:hypothetical protein [Pleurocapsa sp. PCC 7319]
MAKFDPNFYKKKEVKQFNKKSAFAPGSFVAAAAVKVYAISLEELAIYAPEAFNRLKYSGLRSGVHSPQAMQQLLEKIPDSSRTGADAGSAAMNVLEYLRGKDASHVKSFANGGSDNPSNLHWEDKSLNRARGKENMTPSELAELKFENALKNIGGGIKAGLKAAPKAAAFAAAVKLPPAALKYSLRMKRGEINLEEAVIETGKEVAVASAVGGIAAVPIVAVAYSVPAVGAALVAINPALWVIGGATLANEIYQILRHHEQEIKKTQGKIQQRTQEQLDWLEQSFA